MAPTYSIKSVLTEKWAKIDFYYNSNFFQTLNSFLEKTVSHNCNLLKKYEMIIPESRDQFVYNQTKNPNKQFLTNSTLKLTCHLIKCQIFLQISSKNFIVMRKLWRKMRVFANTKDKIFKLRRQSREKMRKICVKLGEHLLKVRNSVAACKCCSWTWLK